MVRELVQHLRVRQHITPAGPAADAAVAEPAQPAWPMGSVPPWARCGTGAGCRSTLHSGCVGPDRLQARCGERKRIPSLRPRARRRALLMHRSLLNTGADGHHCFAPTIICEELHR